MSPIRCTAPLSTINSWTILHLPKSASAKLPSRGMVMVEGTLNDAEFRSVLEPDGKGSHWFKVTKPLYKAIKANAGDTVELVMEPTKEWPEPSVPADIQKALAATPQAQKVWKDITPMAHWDWMRWIGSTANPETRKKRIAVACSKLTSGMRRPCCFNRSM